MWRPSFKCTRNDKCSDVAGETAAALASGAIVFKDRSKWKNDFYVNTECSVIIYWFLKQHVQKISDATYSNELLTAAKSLYAFAKNNQGTYGTTAVMDANKYYR